MDKGLIKIKEIETELSKLKNKLVDTEKLIKNKKIEENILTEKIKYIDRNKKFAEANKKKYINIKENIKFLKNMTIFQTFLWSIIMICIIVLINKFGSVLGNINPIINFLLIIIGGFISFYIGESNNYYSHKKYLKSTNIEEFNNEINVREKELSLVNKSYESVQSDIELLSVIKIGLDDIIKQLEEKLVNINNERNNIINEYINNNKELEELLDIDYESREEKVLIKSQL